MLKDKALENLAAGEMLLERGHANAAVSRLYYAMFQAAVLRLDFLGRVPGGFVSGAVRWEHAIVRSNAKLLRGRFEDRGLYHSVMQLRVQADYYDNAVPICDVASIRGAVRAFVMELTS